MPQRTGIALTAAAVLCALFSFYSVAQADDASAAMFRAGTATSNITPDLDSGISGGFSPFPASHVHDELYARCLVLDDGRIRLALVVCDLLGLHRSVCVEARRLIQKATGIPPECVLISATPTPRHFELGGYETWPGTNYLEPQASVKIMDALLEMTAELSPKSKELLQGACTSQIDKLKKLGARLTLDDHNRVIGVHLGERMVTDADLVQLRGFQHLQELDLTRTRITAAGLTNIKDLPALTKLFLTDTKVDDSGIAHLKGMMNLRLAGLSGTRISDAALDDLRELKGLKQLFCIGTSVTEAGVEKLQQALPQCQITH